MACKDKCTKTALHAGDIYIKHSSVSFCSLCVLSTFATLVSRDSLPYAGMHFAREVNSLSYSLTLSGL